MYRICGETDILIQDVIKSCAVFALSSPTEHDYKLQKNPIEH